MNPFHWNNPPFHWDNPFNETLSVIEYGATGDGTTDDTAAIQAAIDAAEAAGGGTVVVPSGAYKILSTLTIQSSDVQLHLAVDATIIADAAGSYTTIGSDVFMIIIGNSTGTLPLDNVSITGFGTIDANDISTNTSALAAYGKITNASFHDFTVRNTKGTSGMLIVGNLSDEDTCQAGSTSTTIVLATGASADNDTYNGQIVVCATATGAGQWRWITDYVGATRTATINNGWAITPDATTTYQVIEPMENTTMRGIKMIDCDEGCNFHNQYNFSVNECVIQNMRVQDGLEVSRCFSGTITSNKFSNTGPANSLFDIFDTNIDIVLGNNSFSATEDDGAGSPQRGITLNPSVSTIAGFSITGNVFSGALNRGIVFESGNAADVYMGVGVTNNTFHDIHGQDAVGINFADGSVEIITGNVFNRILADDGSGRGIEVDTASDRTIPCRISNNAFTRCGTAGIDLRVAPAGGGIWEITGNTFTGEPGESVFGIRQDVDNIPVYMEGNTFLGTFATNEIKVDAGTGNITFGNGQRGLVVTDNEGTTSGTIADGATIAHGLTGTPDHVVVSGFASTAGDIVSVSSVDGTNITVNVKTGAGAAGTATRVAWRARMTVDAGSI